MAETPSDDQRGSLAESMAHPQANGRAAPVERVERWPIAKLLPYARNPKTHPPEQVELIAKSMARFGQAQIVLVDEVGGIIAGHGRVLAAQKLGWDSMVVGEARGWSDEEKRAYRIADNELGGQRLAPWDASLLKIEVRSLGDGDLKSLLGFDQMRLVQFMSDPTAPDEFAEFGEDIAVDHQCPRCGYKWSGGQPAKE